MPTAIVSLALALAAAAAPAAPAARLAPVPAEEAASTHGPFAMGACETCHERHDAKDPGPARKASDELCFGCHDEFKGSAAVRIDAALHPADRAGCTRCHNPHNARKKKLLL